jgi:hypothetical protein
VRTTARSDSPNPWFHSAWARFRLFNNQELDFTNQPHSAGFVQVLRDFAPPSKRLIGFGMALCKIFSADNKRLIGFGVALCKFYNRLILNDLLALAGAQI